MFDAKGEVEVTDPQGEVETLRKSANNITIRTVSKFDSASQANGSDFEPNPLIDPIWVAMLKLYSKENESISTKKLFNKFDNDIPASSVDRYFRFMQEMHLVETKPATERADYLQIKLTPRAIRLVENGLRARN